MTTTTIDPATDDGLAPAASTPRPFGVVRHSLALAWRSILKIRRTPEQLFDVTLQPIVFLLLFVYLFGGAITGSQHDYLEYVLPGLMVQNALFSTVAIGVNLNVDVTKGVFDRFRSLPISRSAPLVGAVLGEVVRYSVSVVVLLVTAFVMGFRTGTDPLSVLAGCLLVVAFSLCICWAPVLIGLRAREPGAVQGFAFLVMFPLTFGSSTFVRPETMPSWLQTWVHVNPVTHLVEAVRGLLLGGPVAGPLAWTVFWAAVLLAVLGPLAVRAYRLRS
ncbi:MAG TPA: ABC transporter permease [Kineosporiaceae bacterium]|jgi:oleandomycin transport system permease protein|nr:ABC transporter permease [Kineosporiaceae bacterium]